MSVNDYRVRLETLRSRTQSLLHSPRMDAVNSKIALENWERRILYAELELLRLDIEESFPLMPQSLPLSTLLEEINNLTASLSLSCCDQKRQWYLYFDMLIRMIGSYLVLISFAMTAALPCLLFQPIDAFLVRIGWLLPSQQFTVLFKVILGHLMLCVSGIALVVEEEETSESPIDEDRSCQSSPLVQRERDRDGEYNCPRSVRGVPLRSIFDRSRSLVCFSHSSTIDAFILGAAIPVKNCAISKADLFLIPFFNIILGAFGGIAIERSDRKNAINALLGAADTIQRGDCITIAPEGTRSLTGQLAPFKKGPFHLWNHLQKQQQQQQQQQQQHSQKPNGDSNKNTQSHKIPLIPLVIFGAFELFSPKACMVHPGRVYACFLKPIYLPDEVKITGNAEDEETVMEKRRLAMSNLVRRRMLTAQLNCPKDAGGALSWRERIVSICALIFVFLVNGCLVSSLSSFLQSEGVMSLLSQYSTVSLLGGVLFAIVIGTFLVYFLFVIVPRVSRSWKYHQQQKQKQPRLDMTKVEEIEIGIISKAVVNNATTGRAHGALGSGMIGKNSMAVDSKIALLQAPNNDVIKYGSA